MIEAMPGVRPRGGPGLSPDLPSSFGDSSVSCYGGNPPQQSFVPSAPARSRASLAEAAQHARRAGTSGAAARPQQQQQQQQQQQKKQLQQHQPTSAAATGSAGPYHARPGAAAAAATLCPTQHAQSRPGGNAGHGGHAVHGTHAPQRDLDFSVPRDCESDVYGNSDVEEEDEDDDDDSDDGHILDAAAVADDDEPQQQLHKQQSPWGGAAASAGAPTAAVGAPVPSQRPAAPSQQRPPQHPSPPQALYHSSPPCRPPAGAAPSQSQRALAASFRQSLGRNLRVEVSSPNRRSASLPARDLAQAASPGLEAVARAVSQGVPLTAAQQQVCLSAQKSLQQQQQQQRQQPHHQAQMKLSNSAPAVTAMYSHQPRIAPSPPAHADATSASTSTATSGNVDWSFDGDLSPVTRASPEEAQDGAAGVAPQAATSATGGTNRIVRSSSGDKLSVYQEGQRAVAKMRSFSGPLTATLGRSSSQRKQQHSIAMQAQPSLYPTDGSPGISRAPAGPQSSDAIPVNRAAAAQQHRQQNQGRMLQRGGSEPPRDHGGLQQVPFQQASRLGSHASHSAASSPASAHLPLPGSSPSQDDLYPLAGEGPPLSPAFPLSRSMGHVPIGAPAGPPAAVISIPKRRAFPDLPKLDIPWKATDSPRSPAKASQEVGSAPMGMQPGGGPVPVSMPAADQHAGGQHMAGPPGAQAMGGQGAGVHSMAGQNVGGQAMPRHGMGGMGGPGPIRKCVSNVNPVSRGAVVPGARQGQGGVPHGAGRAVGATAQQGSGARATSGRRPGPAAVQDGGRSMVRGGPGPSRHAP